jgi:hypothetical protein
VENDVEALAERNWKSLASNYTKLAQSLKKAMVQERLFYE